MAARTESYPKLFTREEAARTLPLVSRILRDVVDTYGRIERLREQAVEVAHAARDTGSDRSERVEEILGRMEGLHEEVRAFDAELRTIGCVCKDPRLGLVDFPAELEGRVVYLCWRLGEPEIGHWHEVDAGYAGRREIAGQAF